MGNASFSKSAYINTLDWLISYFPNTFSKKPKEIKPLKIGILDDIYAFYNCLQHPEVTKQDIKNAIQYYSSSVLYLANQKENEPRIDLYGQEVDVVNKEQAKYAQQRYEQKMQAKQNHPQTEAEPESE
jgi:ProP effector